MRARHPARVIAIALAALFAHGASAQAPLALYETPQQLVSLPDGRRINLVCQGQGSPTVILTAGAGSWAASWNLVQPLIAKQTRVCAWDRPGYGFSDASAAPQTIDNLTNDLAAALKAGRIDAPYVMVGHSAGAFEAITFTGRNRTQVTGMVLVDPTLPDLIDRMADISPLAASAFRLDIGGRAAAFRRCAANPTQIATADTPICFYTPEHARPLIGIMETRDREASRLSTRASSYEQFEANTRTSRGLNYGEMPLAILTSERGPLGALPVEQPARTAALNKLWNDVHDEMTSLSRRASNRIVPGSGHLVQLDQPDAVADAIAAVVATTRTPKPD